MVLRLLIFFAMVWTQPPLADAAGIEAAIADHRIDVTIDGEIFTSYRYPPDWKFPYLWPVVAPLTGQSLTIEKGTRHPHHRSVYFACDQVNGGNYWQEGMERGRMVSQGARVVESGSRVVITDRCDWYRDDAPSPLRDYRRVTVTAPSPTIRCVQFDIELEFKVDTTILPSNHALFSAEMAPQLAVKAGGRIQNSNGQENEFETFGVEAAWCDYHGKREGKVEGLAILQHPSNPCFPWRFFTRDYGFMSPTPMYWISKKGLQYRAGDSVSMSFLVVAHAGDPQEAGLDRIYEEWSHTPASQPRKEKD